MYYVKWSKTEINNSPYDFIFTEIDNTGKVIREIGLNKHGAVVYKAPTKLSEYGLFDLQKIETQKLTNDMTNEIFERYWEKEIKI